MRSQLNLSREVSGFHTPTALDEMLSRDFEAELGRLRTVPLSPILRPYQREANEAIDEALAERRRKMLLTMATGTGKTLTMVSEAYRLMKSGAARRVLFLVDRRALAAQAVRAFASFEAEPGLKFDKLYPVYSQRFQREDIEDGAQVGPERHAEQLADRPQARRRLRLRLHHPADEHQPVREVVCAQPGRTKRLTTTPTSSTSRSTPLT